MPIPPPVAAAAIQSGGNLLGTLSSALVQSKLNKDERKWNEKMHALQRQESLADYHMQNEYNHPSSMMARLRESGLNPNLVYGNGQAVESAASTNMAPVQSWNPKAPNIDLGAAAQSGITAYYGTQIQQAQIDNLRTQNTVMEQDKLQKAAQTLGILQSTEMGKFDLSQRQALADTVIQTAKAGLDLTRHNVVKTEAETGLIVTRNEVEKAMKEPNIEKVLQEIISMKKERELKQSHIDLNSIEGQKKLKEIDELKQRIHNMWLDGSLKTFELRLKELRGKAADWPGYLKFFNDIVTDVFEMFTPKRPGTK